MNSFPKKLFYLCIFSVMSLFASESLSQGIEPLLKVKELPSGTLAEFYTSEEELYYSIVLDYYYTASVLQAQYMIVADTNLPRIAVPTYWELSNPGYSVIEKYYNEAVKWENSVKSLQSSNMGEKKIELLKTGLSKCKNDLAAEKIKFLQAMLDSGELKNCSEMNDRLIKIIDSLSNSTSKYNRDDDYSINENTGGIRKGWVTAYLGAFIFPTKTDDYETKISFGGGLILNAGNLLGLGKYFDLWLEYFQPHLITHASYYQVDSPGILAYIRKFEWQARMLSIGLGVNMPSVFHLKEFNVNFRTGGGFFWGDGIIPNIQDNTINWNGPTIFFEANTSNNHTSLPLELYAKFSLYFPSEDFDFSSAYKAISARGSSFNNLSAGLRIKF